MRNSLHAVIAHLAQNPGVTAKEMSAPLGRSWESIRNSPYRLERVWSGAYTTRASAEYGRTVWFLTERGREYSRRHKIPLKNDDERTIA